MEQIEQLERSVAGLRESNTLQAKHIEALNDLLLKMAELLKASIEDPEGITPDARSYAYSLLNALIREEPTDSPPQRDFLNPIGDGQVHLGPRR